MSDYSPRYEMPDASSWAYMNTAYGGGNRCIVGNSMGRLVDGSVLPNCVGYAWGRCLELNGYSSLSTGNAGTWYGNTGDGYARGSEPKLGAVICYSGGAGHVAVVESINDDGSITCSESNWSGTLANGRYWQLRTLWPSNNYYIQGSLSFQGFIYLGDWDGIGPGPEPGPVPEPKNNAILYAMFYRKKKKKKGGKYVKHSCLL